MPITSAQTSGLIGGQQAMFSNQMAYSQQIGGAHVAGMQNPYPMPPSYGFAGGQSGAFSHDLGARTIAGLGGAVPGAVAGTAMLGGSLIGGAAGMMDPFTGIGRAFGAGSMSGAGVSARMGVMGGSEGMGIWQGAKNVGGAFARRGLLGGGAALAGGMAAASAMALPYYALGKGVDMLGQNIRQGAQNIQDVGAMTQQYFEPQFGQAGAGSGGASSRGMIKNITSFLHEIAGEDVMTSMKDIKNLMSRAGQSGQLEGVSDANSFRQRFRKIVEDTKKVAQIMGATLEEAAPMVAGLQKMGMWTTSDIMGTAVQAKAAGPNSGAALMGSMQQGAMMSNRMGGTMRAGANLGRNLFGQVSAMQTSGILSNQDIREFTGGQGGAEGRRMIAGSMQRVMAGFGETSMGRMMMAGMGEIKGGEFTGRMDDKLMAKFQRGEIDVGQLQSMGKKRTSNETLATSFFNKSGQMSQAMGAQGGIEGLAQGIQQAMEKSGRGDASAPIQNRFIQLITGASQADADMIQKMIRELPRIRSERERRMSAALDDSFRSLEIRRNRSWEGMKEAIGSVISEHTSRPIQELSEGLTTAMGESFDRMSDSLLGRSKQMPAISFQRQMNLVKGGALQGSETIQNLGGGSLGQSFVDPGAIANFTMGMREGDIGEGMGGMTPRARALMASGLQASRAGNNASRVALGGGMTASSADVAMTARRAMLRGADATMGGLLGGETPEKRKAADVIKGKLRAMMNTKGTSRELRKLKKENPQMYAQKMIEKMSRGDRAVGEALAVLGEGHPAGAGSAIAKQDALAITLGELGYDQSDIGVDFSGMAEAIGGMPDTPEEVNEMHAKNIEKMFEATSGIMTEQTGGLIGGAAGGILGGALGGMKLGAAAGSFFGPIGTAVGAAVGALGGAIVGAGIGAAIGIGLADDELNRSDLEAISASDKFSLEDVKAYAKGNGGADNAFADAANKGDPAAQKLKALLDGKTRPEDKEKLLAAMDSEQGLQNWKVRTGVRDRMKAASRRQGSIGDIRGVSETMEAGLEGARQTFAKGDLSGGLAQINQLASGELSKKGIDQLLRGRGGEAGRGVGRLAAINQMGEMDEAGLARFRDRLNRGGVDLFSGLNQEKFAAMAEGGITGGEVGKLQEMLKKVAPGALGEGPGARKSEIDMLQMQTKYLDANTRFVETVGVVLGDKVETAAADIASNRKELTVA